MKKMLKFMINYVLSGRMRIIFLFTLLLMVNMVLIAQAPDWQWATQAGGIDDDKGEGITIDNAGNTYVTGYFQETATFGSSSLISSGHEDIFIAKMDASGNWQWVTQAGGVNVDIGRSITIDSAGNTYITGGFRQTATFGSSSLISSGYGDIFVAKMDAGGNWQWATQAGGVGWDSGVGITIDNAGNTYITGIFEETAIFGTYSITSNEVCDIFIAKMDASGNWQWATQAGGVDTDFGQDITVDNAGNTYVTGYFQETATFGAYSITSSGSFDIFIAKMDASGNWQWATQAGGVGWDSGVGITIDNAGNTYITGIFEETAIFGTYSITSNEVYDIFIAKMDAGGNWQWVTQAGGIDVDFGQDITIDNAGNTYVTGCFRQTATFGAYSITSSGGVDIFVAKLNSSVFAENEISTTINSLSNYPNPFNPKTTISFSVTQNVMSGSDGSSFVTLDIYNIKGQLVKVLVNDFQDAGEHSIIWDGNDSSGKNVSSGIYFYKLKVSGKTEAVKKCLLLK